MRNTLRTSGQAAAGVPAVAKGATLAPFLRRPVPLLDFGPRRPPQSRRLRAPAQVPTESRIVLRRGAITLR
jgi:hypothetical protein